MDDSVLFDLPLVSEPELANKPRPKPRVEVAAVGQNVEALAEQIALPQEPPAAIEPQSALEEGEEAAASLLGRRVVAGAIDTAILAAALGLLLAGAAALGIRPALSDWPGYALVGLVLSFLYAVFPLLFWGATPGMQRTGLRAGSADGSPLTLGQVLLRWLGGVGTVALLGLPTLLDLEGSGSLSDRISGSRIDAA